MLHELNVKVCKERPCNTVKGDTGARSEIVIVFHERIGPLKHEKEVLLGAYMKV